MASSAYHDPAELDSGDPPVRFSLTPSSIFSPNRREIFVRRQAWNDNLRVLAVVERVFSRDREEATCTRESERFLDTRQDLVLPLYTLPAPSRAEWNIEIAYGQGALRVDYPFRTRDDVLRFQQLLTSYVPVAQFDDITCVVTYKGWRLRQPQYAGFGQVQLWKQPERKEHCLSCAGLSPVSSTHSSGSTWIARPRAPTPSIAMGSGSLSIGSVQTGCSHARSTTTIQTDIEKNKSVLVTEDSRPPMMVAFLNDKSHPERYSMLKIDITDLTQTELTSNREEALLCLIARSGSTFPVHKQLPVPGRVPLSAWNLCELQRKGARIPLVDQLECSHLALNFGSDKDPANKERRSALDMCMLKLRQDRLEQLLGRAQTRNHEIAIVSQEMKEPPQPVSTPPTSLSRIPSRAHKPLELLPEISTHTTWIDTDFISNAGTVNSSRAAMTPELDIVPDVS